MGRVRARRGHQARYQLSFELLMALHDPDPNDAELAAAWWAVRAELPPQPPEEDEPLWAFWPGVPEQLRVAVEAPDLRLAMHNPTHAAYHRQAERAQAQLVARKAWLRAHPEMTAP